MLFGLFGNRSTADPEVGAALDLLIERIDPRLALVGGCRRTLGRPTERALRFARELVARLPAPIPLRAEDWSSEPRRRTRVLTQALQGEVVQRDVPRTSVSFGDHRVSSPCATAAALRADLERRALEFVAERAAARLAALDGERKEREQERDVLKARMRLAGRAGHGLASADAEALAASLAKCEARLAELAGDLGARAKIVAETLAAPEQELRLAVHTLRLDQMNFVADAADGACAEVTFVEATSSAELSRVLVPVKIHRAELAPARDALADAEKYL